MSTTQQQSTSLDALPRQLSPDDAPVQPSVTNDDDSQVLVHKIMERLNKNGDESSGDNIIPSSQTASASTEPTVDADSDVRSRKKADAANDDTNAKATAVGTKTAPKPSLHRGVVGNVAHVVPQMSMVHQILESVKSVVLFTLLYTILSNELVQGFIKRLPYVSDGSNVNILGTVVLGMIGGSVLTATNLFT